MRVEQYREAFQAVYPQVKLGLRVTKKYGQSMLWVSINGSTDNRPLTADEVNSAILDFKRGRTH